MIPIFKIGDVNYSDKGLDKPVRFTANDLQTVASKTSDIRITDEHKDVPLGVLSNFVVKDGCLMADEPEGFDLNGMGLSPVFSTELVDMGDYYSIAKINMDEIGLTKSPRNRILYNTVTSMDNTEVNMGESALEKVIREKDELQKKIGVLESNERMYKRQIKQHEEEIQKIKESYSDADNLIEENKALKEKAEAYDVINNARKEELIHDIVGDDDKLAKEYEGLSVETLELVRKTMKVSTPQKGVTSNDYPVDDGNDPVDDGDDEEEYTDEMFEADFEASGL